MPSVQTKGVGIGIVVFQVMLDRGDRGFEVQANRGIKCMLAVT